MPDSKIAKRLKNAKLAYTKAAAAGATPAELRRLEAKINNIEAQKGTIQLSNHRVARL